MQPLKVSKNLLGYNSTNSKKFKILTGHLFHAKSIPHTLGLVNHLLSEQEIYFQKETQGFRFISFQKRGKKRKRIHSQSLEKLYKTHPQKPLKNVHYGSKAYLDKNEITAPKITPTKRGKVKENRNERGRLYHFTRSNTSTTRLLAYKPTLVLASMSCI